jgi:hypothetical protein
MLSNAVPDSVWKDTIRANTDELRSAVVVAAFAPKKKKQATLTRQTLANLNPVAARGVAVMALAAALAVMGACSSTSSDTTNVTADGGGTGGKGGSTGSHPDASDGPSVPLSCDNATLVLENNCTGCHAMTSGPFSGDLDLVTPNIGARLVGKPAATMNAMNQAMCSGKGNLLNRGHLPATGVFIDKINASPGGVCGSPMPLGGSMLAQEDLDCLQAWANGLVNSVGP